MSSITITLKDGTVREFPHEGRAGGSYSKHLDFQGPFVIVVDEWQKRIYIPVAEIAEIIETPERRAW